MASHPPRLSSDSNPATSVPTVAASSESIIPTHDSELADLTASSAGSSSEEDSKPKTRLQRPKISTRKSSRTLIISRDNPNVEVARDDDDENDRGTMSPRRSSEECEKLGQDARRAFMDQAKALQANLLDILERVESVKSEHEKLEGGNRFLQSYIGELMQTSKITSTGANKGKGKGRHVK